MESPFSLFGATGPLITRTAPSFLGLYVIIAVCFWFYPGRYVFGPCSMFSTWPNACWSLATFKQCWHNANDQELVFRKRTFILGPFSAVISSIQDRDATIHHRPYTNGRAIRTVSRFSLSCHSPYPSMFTFLFRAPSLILRRSLHQNK